jgi:hypothetical protein
MSIRSCNPALLSSFLIAVIGFANFSCEKKEKEEDAANTQSQVGAGVGRSSGGSVNSVEQMPGFQSLLLDIPPSMTGGEQAQALRLLEETAGEDDGDGDGLQNMLLMPAMMLGVGDQMADMIGKIADHVFGKPECRLGGEEVGSEECEGFVGLVKGVITTSPQIIDLEQYGDLDDGNAPNFIKYYANAEGDYDYTFEFYWKGADDLYYHAINFEISPLNDEQASGRVVFFKTALADEEASEGPSTMEIIFDNSVEPKVMSMIGYAIQGGEDQPTKFGIDFAASSDGLVKASGIVYRKELAEDLGPLAPFQTKEAMAFVFKVAADSAQDLAVQALAIPQEANFGHEDLFADFSVEDIMGGILVTMLRAEPSDDSGIDCSLAGAWIGMSEGNICATNSAVTDAEVLLAAQEFCAENASSEICGLINQLDGMKNPIYMTKDGLVGTGSVDETLGDFSGAEAALEDIETPAVLEFVEQAEPTAPVGIEVVE